MRFITLYKNKVNYFVADCTSETSIQELYKFTLKKFLGIDILINNIGDGRGSENTFPSSKEWSYSLEKNFNSALLTSEIFIKLDEELDENWIMLVYLKDNDPASNIIVEDKTNPGNNQSNEYKPNEIFKFSDALVDSLTSMIDREYKKKLN